MTSDEVIEVLEMQLVAWVEANKEAAIRSPQCSDWSNGVASGCDMALAKLRELREGKGEK